MVDPLLVLYWERLKDELDLDRQMPLEAGSPLPEPQATPDLLATVFDRPDTAVKFSEQLSTLLKNAGVKLADDETCVCTLYVAKKSTYVSQVADPTPEPAHSQFPQPRISGKSGTDFPFTELVASAWRAIRYKKIMVPAIMKAINNKLEQDRIAY